MEDHWIQCPAGQFAWQCLLGLGIPAELFDHRFDKCYCDRCAKPRRRRDGQGSTPVGYTRFATSVEPKRARALGIFAWPKAFHGTKMSSVQPVVQTGYLLCPGATTPSGVMLGIRDGHIAKDGIKREVTLDAVRVGRAGITSPPKIRENKLVLDFNPTLCAFLSSHYGYAQHQIYAEKARVQDTAVTFLLEFRLKPGSFDEGPHTFSEKCLAEVETNAFSTERSGWEWFTDRYGVMQLTGILVKVWTQTPPSSPSLPQVASDLGLGNLDVDPKKMAAFLSCHVAKRRMELLRASGLWLSHLLDEAGHKCYCDRCEPGTDQVYRRGGETYRLPHGFTRFGIAVDASRKEAEKVFDTWPVAYHGTTLSHLGQILETGTLIPMGAKLPNGQPLKSRDEGRMREGRTADATRNQEGIFFTPLVDYASHDVHASASRVSLRGREHQVKVVLMLRVRPGFERSPSTIRGFSPHSSEAAYRGQEEWSTSRHASVVIYGVLLKDC